MFKLQSQNYLLSREVIFECYFSNGSNDNKKKHFWSIKNNKIKRAEIGLFFNETLTNMVMNNRRKYSIREIDEVL